LKERWGRIYPKVVKKWEEKADAIFTFQLERIAKEIKRRVKVVEVFPDEGSAERLLYLILRWIDDRLNSRKLRGFNGG